MFGKQACASFLRTQIVLKMSLEGFKARPIAKTMSLYWKDYAGKRAPVDGRQVVSCKIMGAVQWQKPGRWWQHTKDAGSGSCMTVLHTIEEGSWLCNFELVNW